MNSVCPFMTYTDADGNLRLMRCRSDCVLNLSVDCSIKLLGISALNKLHSQKQPTDSNQTANTPDKA